MLPHWWLLFPSGIFAGFLAGLLGIGGGVVLVPILVSLGFPAVQSVATSSLAIVITSTAGSLQNWRMGYLDFKRVILIAIPSILTVPIGVYLANKVPDYILLAAFGFLLVFNIFMTELRKEIVKKKTSDQVNNIAFKQNNYFLARLATGGSGGLLAGFFGVGGGIIMVPLQILLLQENIKTAIQTSLGVIVVTSLSATIGHAAGGNVLFGAGVMLGLGGLLGVQISTRYLPRLPEQVVSFCFRTMLAFFSIYFFYRAWNSIN